MKLKAFFLRLYWLLDAQLGFNPRTFFRAIKGLPRYLADLRRFRSLYKGPVTFTPCLHDWYEEGGAGKDEYFLQDLMVARMIFEANPEKHVDVGSRVDGFVAHVASFRQIEVFDVRPITAQIPGVEFIRADLMNPVEKKKGWCDSLSCLHALEHFGLGRYGDPIDPRGFEHGLANMSDLLRKDGVFYLSVPIGVERVEFNANHVFDPRVVIRLAAENRLEVTGLTIVSQNGRVEASTLADEALDDLSGQPYNLGIFLFRKKS